MKSTGDACSPSSMILNQWWPDRMIKIKITFQNGTWITHSVTNQENFFFPGGGEFIWELGLHICFCDFFKNKVNEYCIELYFIGFIGNFRMLKLKYKIKCIKYWLVNICK